jgi:PAS domain S-box-containing protein
MALKAPTAADSEGLREVRSLDLAALKPQIERVCRLAAGIAGAAHAYVVLNEDGEIWHSAFAHLPEALADARQSASVRSDSAVWVEDARLVEPDHPWVVQPPFARFYCATPLFLSSGARIGALCVIDPETRPANTEVQARLADCAAMLSEAVERLRAERAREQANREKRTAVAVKEAVMRSAPVALALVDRDMRYVYVNARWCEDAGVTRERAIGTFVGDLFPQAYAELKDTFVRVLEGETFRSDRVKASAAGRSDRWLRAEVGPWRDGDGETVGLIVMTHDITEIIQSLERSERSEQRLKLALEIADVMVYEIDYRAEELRIEGVGDSFFGGKATYADIAANPFSVVHPDDQATALAEWRRCLAQGVPFRHECRVIGPDGGELWAFSGAEMSFEPDGKPGRLLGVLSNITDRKRSEAQVVQARDAAESASRAKSEFLANMSHEIRTPLNGVMGVAGALARTDLTAAQAEMVHLIETSGQTLEAILSDLLDLARIESGKLDVKCEPFHLETSLRAVAELFRPLSRDKGLTFDVDLDREADGWFQGDAVRLRQVLGNLLSNAVKFTGRGRVGLCARIHEGLLTVAVSDTGIGFDDDFKARLFERFEQADGSITRRFGGTGLGLAISSQLAEALGGDLSATARPGEGATFVLTLPLTPADVPEAARIADQPGAAHASAPRVLLAEDHAVNRRVVQLLLEPLGVQLTCVENGAEAVAAASAGGFDLVLMDMQMPVMDGLTAIRRIREAERAEDRGRLPIWGLSANALPEHRRASAEAGADGHLTKPISPEALFEALSLACGGAEEAVAA